MSTPQSDADFCAELVRNHDFGRYAATLFAPDDARRSLLALYAFNATIERVRDQVSQPLPGEIRLQWWTDALSGHGHGDVEHNPVAAELLRAVRDHQLPIDRLLKLVDAHIVDLYNDPMPDLAVLESHLRDSESTLLLCAAMILGDRSDAAEHAAEHGGLAIGIARLIARMPRDAARRQVFVPLDMLVRHGSSAEEVFAGPLTPAIEAALTELIAVAREHLSAAQTALGNVLVAARPAFLPMALARSDLAQMTAEKKRPDVPARSRLRTLWTLWRATRSAPFR
jgi:phytoene synthase